MANILPFKAIRPTGDKVHLVASRSIDGYDSYELRDKLAGNPYSFLHVVNPDYTDGKRTRPGSKERLQKVKSRFKSFMEDNVLLQDEQAAYYIYRQIKGDMEYTGIIACTSIDDYLNGVIKIHEQTITQREVKLKEYLEVCEFNAEPVLFCYPNDQAIDGLINEITYKRADYDFTTTDRIRHTLWVANNAEQVNLIQERFANMPSIYIADGHHRSASSALLGQSRRIAQPDYKGNESFNFFLGAFFSESQLKIYDYNRLVKEMNNLSPQELLSKLKEKFEVKEQVQSLYVPSKKHEISMYMQGKWYALVVNPSVYDQTDPVKSLDASILTEQILAPIFGIRDLKIDKRVAFVPGIKGPEALKKSVDEGKAELAFGLYPVTMEQLRWIADTNNIMPPKTTWVEPKLRSGLVIYSFEK
jgi:uncharacterized protein (DUF1015 family)